MTKRRLVLIEWLDAYGCSTDWREIPSIIEDQPMLCRSVGWIVAKGKTSLTIVPHLSPSDHGRSEEQGCGDMTIPIRCIKRIIMLREAEA